MARGSSTPSDRNGRKVLPSREDLQPALNNESMEDRCASESSSPPASSSTQSLKAHSSSSSQGDSSAANQQVHSKANGIPRELSSTAKICIPKGAPINRSYASELPTDSALLPKDGAAGMTGSERNLDRMKNGKPARGRPKGVKNGQGKSGAAALERMRKEAASSNALAHAVYHAARSNSRTPNISRPSSPPKGPQEK